jgi:hypothetical protein
MATAGRGCVSQGFNLVFVTTGWSQKVVAMMRVKRRHSAASERRTQNSEAKKLLNPKSQILN